MLINYITVKRYHSGGMLMPGRIFSSADYSFGFNGKENENELKGLGNHQDYGMRVSDPRLVRFMSVDPLTAKFPWYSPYQFAGNKHTIATDLDGLEENIIIQWYDPQNPLQWIGSTGLKVSNSNDRILGMTGILYLQLDKTPANEDLVARLLYASVPAKQALGNKFFSRIMENSGIIKNGKITSNNASYQQSSTSINEIENRIIDIAEAKISEGGRGAGNVYPPTTFIGFESDAFQFNPNLDIDENGLSNQLEFESSVLYLKQNPTVTANVLGNSSSETIIRDNSKLAGDRANTVGSKIISTGVDGSRVSSSGSFSNNSQKNVETDRNAKVHYNIPRR